MYRIYFILIALILLLLSCNEYSTNVEADLTDYESMIRQPGFQWIPVRQNDYEPLPDKIDSIKKYYKSSEYSFLIFAKPSCTCEGPHNQLAYLFKIFELSEIDYNDSEIYAMNSIRNIHPYEDTLKINDLPAFFVLKNGEPFYSIRDTLTKRVEESQNKDKTLEGILYEALNQ